jgi:hypothetical protein
VDEWIRFFNDGHVGSDRGNVQPVSTTAWMGQQGSGHLAPPGPTHGRQVQQGMGTPNLPDAQAPQVLELQLGEAQIAVADTPQHRIENKRWRKSLLAMQSPKTHWMEYRGNFDSPPALHHPAASVLSEWATYGFPTCTGRRWTKEEMMEAKLRGPHRSVLSNKANAHFKAEVDEKVKTDQAKLVAWDSIKDDPPAK